MTPGSGKATLQSTLADLIARFGLESVERGLRAVNADPKWQEIIRQKQAALYPEMRKEK